MIMTSNRAANRTLSTNTKASQLDFTMITTDWRNGGGIKPEEEFRKVWYCSAPCLSAILLEAYNRFSLNKNIFVTIIRIGIERPATQND